MSIEECSQLVQTVLATHRRCASEGNTFDVNRVLLTLEEHNAILSNATDPLLTAEKEDDQSETLSDATASCEEMLKEANDAAVLLSNITNLRNCGENKLKEMLLQTQKELNLKNGEILKMTKLKDRITNELAELTSCLFEEANRMVNEANRDRHVAEQKAKECEMAMALLQEEVKLLKSVAKVAAIPPSHKLRGGSQDAAARAIISSSNSHSSYKDGCSDKRGRKGASKRKEKTKAKVGSVGERDKSSLYYCACCSAPVAVAQPIHDVTTDEMCYGCCCSCSISTHAGTTVHGVCREASNLEQLDMKCFNEFLLWRQNPLLKSDVTKSEEDSDSDFYQHILTNDIRPCLSFCTEQEMHERLLKACEANLVSIEKLNCCPRDCSSSTQQLQISNNNTPPIIKHSSSSSSSSSDGGTVTSAAACNNCGSSGTSGGQARHCQLSHGGMRVCEYKVFIADGGGGGDHDCGDGQREEEEGQSSAAAGGDRRQLQHCFIVCKAVRDRIAAVCELLTFLRHVSLNLYTKTESIDLFLKLTHLQAICCLTRLGFIFSH